MLHHYNGYTITTSISDNTIHIWKILNSKAYATVIEITATTTIKEYKTLINSYCNDTIFPTIATLTKEVL